MTTMKYAAIAALLSCSLLTPVAPAIAAPAPSASDKLAVCQQYVLDSNYSVIVNNENDVTNDSGPVAGSEHDVNPRADTSGAFDYAGFTRAADPLVRHGGSPNMWGQAGFTQKVFRNSLVDVETNYAHTITYNWNCKVTQRVTEFVPADHPGNNNGDNEQDGGNLDLNNGCGNGNGGPAPTTPPPGCGPKEIVTLYIFNHPQSVEGDPIADAPQITATGVSRAGHVTGVPESDYIVTGIFAPTGAQTLACISPSNGSTVKGNPGGWRAVNGYVGGHCNTATFNAAATVNGQVFDPITSNSLPGF